MDGDIGSSYRQRKRPHSQMDHEGSLSPTRFQSERLMSIARESNTNANGHPYTSHSNNISVPNIRRYVGDGLDFRRPAHLSQRQSSPPIGEMNVIDLTNDDAGPSTSSTRRHNPPPQRQPRFARNIMDTHEIIDLDDEGSRGVSRNGVRRPVAPLESPDIEFVSSRTIPPRSRRNSDNELEITGSATLVVERRHWLQDHLTLEGGLLDPVRSQAGWDRLRGLRDHILDIANLRPPRRANVSFVGPALDFETVGFRLYEDEPIAPAAPPTYNAPEPAPDGFTRTVKEEDQLICPNCEQELCKGEPDIKKQVWMVRGCGHVYCGECTINRFSSRRSAKGKEKIAPENHKPFKACVVEGCEARTHHRAAMFQLFL